MYTTSGNVSHEITQTISSGMDLSTGFFYGFEKRVFLRILTGFPRGIPIAISFDIVQRISVVISCEIPAAFLQEYLAGNYLGIYVRICQAIFAGIS